MDEIDWMKQFKRFFKYAIIANIGFATLILISSFICYIVDKDIEWFTTAFVFLKIATSISVFLILVYIVAYLIYKLTYVKIDVNLGQEYIRELHNYYPPAIISLIYDLRIEVYRDYTATILYLYTKKYINISGFGEDILISKGENEEISNLSKHEIYVYECLIYKQSLDESKFKNLIIEDAQEKQVIVKGKIKSFKPFIIGLLILIISIIIGRIIGNRTFKLLVSIIASTVIAVCWIIPYIVFILTPWDKCRRTTKGKQELKKIKAFKNFIKDYTLIEEKDIEHIQLLEEYIPYSLSLGATPQVEEYIKQNEIYRNLIYKGRENWT